MNHINTFLRPEISRLLALQQLGDRHTHLGAELTHPHAPTPNEKPLPKTAASTWEPSTTATLLTEALTRSHAHPPTIALTVEAVEVAVLAKELRAAMQGTELSHHARLAEATQAGKPLETLPKGALDPHPFDHAITAAMTGQIHMTLHTPAGHAGVTWHRTEEDDASGNGYIGKIHSASLAIEHPQLGTIVAKLDLSPQQLAIHVRCPEHSAPIIQQSLPSLLTNLSGVHAAPAVHLSPSLS